MKEDILKYVFGIFNPVDFSSDKGQQPVLFFMENLTNFLFYFRIHFNGKDVWEIKLL